MTPGCPTHLLVTIGSKIAGQKLYFYGAAYESTPKTLQ